MNTTKERSKPYDVQATCDSLGCDPMRILAEIALGDLACSVCCGAGKTKHQRSSMADGKERTCEKCSGSGKETITPELRAKAVSVIAKYISPAHLAELATKRMREILKTSTDSVAIEAAKTSLERHEAMVHEFRMQLSACLARTQREQ